MSGWKDLTGEDIGFIQELVDERKSMKREVDEVAMSLIRTRQDYEIESARLRARKKELRHKLRALTYSKIGEKFDVCYQSVYTLANKRSV